jgi:hypothetical protein
LLQRESQYVLRPIVRVDAIGLIIFVGLNLESVGFHKATPAFGSTREHHLDNYRRTCVRQAPVSPLPNA